MTTLMNDTTEILAGDVVRRLKVLNRSNPDALNEEVLASVDKLALHLKEIDAGKALVLAQGQKILRLQSELDKTREHVEVLRVEVEMHREKDGLLKNVPANNVEAERAYLGAVMLDGNVLLVEPRLEAEDFYRHAHGLVFEAMQEVRRRGEPIDSVMVVNELRRTKRLEDAGGPMEIAALMQNVPTAANGGFYAKLVKEASNKRALTVAGAELQRDGFDPRVTAEKMAKRIREIADKFAVKPDPADARHASTD